MVTRARTSRRSARRCGLKAEPVALHSRWLTGAPLPTGQGDRLGPNEFYVDPIEIVHLSSRRREPA